MAIRRISIGTESFTLLLAVMAFIYMLSSPVEARDIIVGVDNGWNLNGFDYTAWAQGQKFAVGDNLVFKYNSAEHNVYMVGGSAFKQCSTDGMLGSFNSGEDSVPLNKDGNMWFLCSVADHCEQGMKFKITVASKETGGASSPSSAASSFMVVSFALLAIFLL